jgi:hypothetical protein
MHGIYRFSASLLLVVTLALSGCQKYEDGPTFSLQSREGRVTGNWVAELVSRNEIEETSEYAVFNVQFSENGRMTWRTQTFAVPVLVEVGASWELANLDEEIKVTFDQVDPVSGETRLLYLKIQRLTKTELWFDYQISGDRWRVRLRPA